MTIKGRTRGAERSGKKVALPTWAGKEVTRDPRYLNANLFKKPYRGW